MKFLWCLLIVCAQRSFAAPVEKQTNPLEHFIDTAHGLLDNLQKIGTLTGIVSAEDVANIRGIVSTVDNVLDVVSGTVADLFGHADEGVLPTDAKGKVGTIIDQVDGLLADIKTSTETGKIDIVEIEKDTQQILDHVFGTINTVLNTVEHVGEITGIFDGDDVKVIRNVVEVVDVALEHATSAVAAVAGQFTGVIGNVFQFFG